MLRNCSLFMVILALAGGCSDPRCPPGYFQKDDTCYRCRPVGGANSAACIVGDAAVLRAEDDAGDDSGMDGGSSDTTETSDDAESAPPGDPRAGETGSGSGRGDSEGDARAGDSGSVSGGSDDAETNGSCAAGPADSGTTCQVDPCSPSPCATGFSCLPTPSATASCVASCVGNELGCQPGDTCGTDEECRSGGDANASCDANGKVCVTLCPTTSIVSESNLEAARYCREIDGDLIVNPTFATIPPTALPYLTRVRGRFHADLSGALNTSAESLTFGALQSIGGNLSFGFFQNATLLSFPRLTSVGGDMNIALAPALERLSLPQLTSVQGNVQLGAMPINQLDIGRLQSIGSSLTLGALCRLPWSQVSRVASLVASPSVANIGCCTGQTTQRACSGGCMCN